MYEDIRYLCIIVVLITPTFNSAQEWVATYNGPGNSNDCALSMAIGAFGNVYVTGMSYGSTTDYDYATIKYDSSGVEQWVMRYDGPASGSDRAVAITLDNAGNVYVTGRSDGVGTGYDYATVKYNAMGAEQWVARYDGPLSDDDNATAIGVDNEGYVYVTGASWGSGTSLDYATIKYDSSGVQQWVARYNGPVDLGDYATAIALDDVSNAYVTGYSHAGTGIRYDYATIKYNSSGTEQWVARYNGPESNHDYAYAIALDATCNVYITGRSWGIQYDYCTVKYDSSGVEQWVARYNGPFDYWDEAYAIILDTDANVYVTGKSDGGPTLDDYATVKYDSSGIEQWVARYTGPGPLQYDDCAQAIAVNDSGSVFVTGYSGGQGTSDDFATIKYDSSGIEQWVIRYNGLANSADWATAIGVDFAGHVHITGYADDPVYYLDYTTIKYSSTGIAEQEITNGMKHSHLGTTIFRGALNLPKNKKCRVFNITGRLVEPRNIQPGIYFVEIDGVVTQKVVKVR